MNNPNTPKYGNTEIVQLSWTEAKKLADAAERAMSPYRSRAAAARALGVTDSALQSATSRSASLTMRRGLLDKLGEVFNLDVRGWAS